VARCLQPNQVAYGVAAARLAHLLGFSACPARRSAGFDLCAKQFGSQPSASWNRSGLRGPAHRSFNIAVGVCPTPKNSKKKTHHSSRLMPQRASNRRRFAFHRHMACPTPLAAKPTPNKRRVRRGRFWKVYELRSWTFPPIHGARPEPPSLVNVEAATCDGKTVSITFFPRGVSRGVGPRK